MVRLVYSAYVDLGVGYIELVIWHLSILLYTSKLSYTFFNPLKKIFLEALGLSLNTACFASVKTTKPLNKKRIFTVLL